MNRRLPSLTALRAFEAVARTRSFTRAAAELGVTQTAVSRQVRALETALAVQLVNREPSGNSLTQAGEILFAGVYQGFDTIGRSVERITGSGSREILNISVAPFFSERWLTPRLMDFLELHPAVDVRLHHTYHPADHRREGIDIGINWGTGLWPGVKAEKLVDGAFTPVIAPALRTRLGSPPSPEALAGLTLFYEFDIRDWQHWFAAAGTDMPAGVRSMRLSDTHALRRVALDGHGATLLFAGLIHSDLAEGRLVQPFPLTVNTGTDYYLNYPDDTPLPYRARLFRDWLLDEAALRPVA